jgi:hypothetical protein
MEEPGWYGGNRVPNAIMLSEPGHPLWLHCMELAARNLGRAGARWGYQHTAPPHLTPVLAAEKRLALSPLRGLS